MVLKKSLGQNFIFDKIFLKALLKNIDLKNQTILEVGCGNGNLTELLLNETKKVIGFEVDKHWCAILKEKFSQFDNFELHCEDFLKSNISLLSKEKMVFFSNIPYYISSKIIEKLIENSAHFYKYYTMVQWDFALRLFSAPHSKQYSSLSIFFQSQFSGKILRKVPASVFTPSPKVDSAFIYFENDKKIPYNKDFFQFIKILFSKRRKQIINTLSSYCKKKGKNDIINILKELKINEKERVENLSLNILYNLFIALS